MPATSGFQTHAIQLTIRFIQGYRYIDRCGSALVKLENTLREGWITAEPSPQAGILKNDQLGMALTFNSESMTVHQGEFISFDYFLDQACKIYDALWQEFEVKRINAPAARIVLQKGFNDAEIDEATGFMLKMNLCTPHAELETLLGGKTTALDFVLVTTEDLVWKEELVHRRRRMQASVIRQEKQVPFDNRMLSRSRLLPDNQRDAIQALMRLRRQHPEVAPVAAQLDLENSLETEFRADGFDLPAFLDESWQWGESVRTKLPNLEKGKR